MATNLKTNRKVLSRAREKLEAAVEVVNEVLHDETTGQKQDMKQSAEYKFSANPALIKEMEDKFDFFDTNNDRGLDLKELAVVMRALGQNPTHRELINIMAEADKDRNGKLDKAEYIELLRKHMKTDEQVEEELKEAFYVFDKKGTGCLDIQTLKEVIQVVGEPLSEEEANQLIKQMDSDDDKEIDIEEFVQFLCNPTKSRRTKKTEKPKNPDVKRRK